MVPEIYKPQIREIEVGPWGRRGDHTGRAVSRTRGQQAGCLLSTHKELKYRAGVFGFYMLKQQSVFRRYGISYHIDQKVPMHSHPFIQFIMSLLECYMRNYEFGAFMNVLKTGYLCEASKRHYIDQLENFVLERGWMKPTMSTRLSSTV